MKNALLALGLSTMLATAPLSTAAFADDRPPTPAERAELTDILNAAGFKSWRKIELDDGKWEVDDAVHQDGRVFDVDIRNGKIIKMEIDD